MLDHVEEQIVGEVQRLLTDHGVERAPQDHLSALATTIRHLRRAAPPSSSALVSRDRQDALASARALRRHLATPPRRPESTDAARRKLLARIDGLRAVVKLVAATGFDAGPAIERLRASIYTPADLEALIDALAAVPPGAGAARRNAPFVPLIRAGVMTWEACGRPERYALNQFVDPPALQGPLPDFLRDLIRLAGLPMPTDDVLHRHLRSLKNL